MRLRPPAASTGREPEPPVRPLRTEFVHPFQARSDAHTRPGSVPPTAAMARLARPPSDRCHRPFHGGLCRRSPPTPPTPSTRPVPPATSGRAVHHRRGLAPPWAGTAVGWHRYPPEADALSAPTAHPTRRRTDTAATRSRRVARPSREGSFHPLHGLFTAQNTHSLVSPSPSPNAAAPAHCRSSRTPPPAQAASAHPPGRLCPPAHRAACPRPPPRGPSDPRPDSPHALPTLDSGLSIRDKAPQIPAAKHI
jgi:hypothetical protein